MSKETERKALFAHFQSVAEGDFGEHIAWPNKPFETPQRKAFLVVNIVDRGNIRTSLGTTYIKRCFRTLQVDIYTPQDQGTKQSREVTDVWELVYDMLVLPTADGEKLTIQTPRTRSADTNEIRAANLDDNWDRFIFEAPFYRDQIVEK